MSMFGVHSGNGFTEVLPGISIKTVCSGRSTLMTEFRLKAGSMLSEHSHPHEQTGYLVKGRMKLYIDGAGRELGPGDSWCVAGGLPHRAEIREDSVAIEVFSPAREDYLKYLNPADVVEA
jgi:quercetin dioxygenase-like cupin family protein